MLNGHDKHDRISGGKISVRKQQSVVRHVATLGHNFLIPSPLVFVLTPVSAAYLAGKQKYDFYSLWFDPTAAH
jgi:hypothetical protein